MKIIEKIEKFLNEVSPGVALRMLTSMLGKLKNQKEIDIWYVELSKSQSDGYKYWNAMNDTAKKTLLKAIKKREKELGGK